MNTKIDLGRFPQLTVLGNRLMENDKDYKGFDLSEKMKVNVTVETPSTFNDIPSKRSVALDRLGFNNHRLTGEAMRYVAMHGNNLNYVEAEFPLDDIELAVADIVGEDNITNPEATDLINKTFSTAVDVMCSHIEDITRSPDLLDLHNKIKSMGQIGDITVAGVDELLDGGHLKIRLEVDRVTPISIKHEPKEKNGE